MNKYTIEYNGIRWERVSKRAARKHLREGREIGLLPCKILPSRWMSPLVIRKENINVFDSYVNTYEYYNCMYDTGYYASFYARERI